MRQDDRKLRRRLTVWYIVNKESVEVTYSNPFIVQ